MAISMKDKVVFVTGGGAGIGAATALEFAKLGAKVMICARRESTLREMEAKLREAGASDVHTFVLNVRDREAVEAAIAQLPDAWQAVDVLVSTSDPPHFLWAAVHFLLNGRPAGGHQGRRRTPMAARLRRPGWPAEQVSRRHGLTKAFHRGPLHPHVAGDGDALQLLGAGGRQPDGHIKGLDGGDQRLLATGE